MAGLGATFALDRESFPCASIYNYLFNTRNPYIIKN